MPTTRTPWKLAPKTLVASVLAATAVLAPAAPASAQEPAACLSADPAVWPASSKPYFLLLVDTSGSMTACTTPPTAYPTECNQGAAGYALNACGMVPNRINDAKCALRQTVQAFAGEANFGLATFASTISGCAAGACASSCGAPTGGNCDFDVYGCSFNLFPGAADACGNNPACGPGAGPAAPNFAEGVWRNGGNMLVGIEPDTNFVNNGTELLKYFDGQCSDSKELFAAGGTPIAGALQTAAQYLRAGWTQWSPTNYCPPLAYNFGTPMNAADRLCRNLNVLLVTDGDESCQTQAAAVAAATDLFNNGVTIAGKNWKVKTYVVNFAGGSIANTNQIAAAGGTTQSFTASNSVTLATALSNIIGGSIKPETCDNTDNNCNGCTDEGFTHYCNAPALPNPPNACCTWSTLAQRSACGANACGCCNWSTVAQRNACLGFYGSSITPGNPQGDLGLLPCTTPAQQTQPANWLCFNPGDSCDNADNNCSAGIDEGQLKCGNPLACPKTEVCNGADDDCDGATDEGCPTPCNPSTEVCDGCDNDCDGVADDGIAAVPCGLSGPGEPPWCQGTLTCKAPQAVTPGGCVPGGGFNPCNAVPQAEVCNSLDDDCDSIIDDSVASVPCVPPGTPGGLNYGPNSQCKMGNSACVNGMTVCQGFVGPSPEICDGLDNDCDGQVDESTFGSGQPCGINQPPCTPGTTACVNGTLVCSGGTQPGSEVCNGVDDDCDGTIDDAPLADGPGAGMNGCWNLPGNCCTFQNLSWCPPLGGTCTGNGALTPPCNKGTLACQGAQGWVCVGPKGPAPEACDNLDNDCNGTIDDSIAGLGQVCGSDVGECQTGLLACTAGVLDCVGDVPPSPEACDGLDNDCDTVIDNGISTGGPCTVPYDMVAYPGPRDNPPCQPGILQCNGMGGTTCVGGVGPSPEVCDGIDNDCDGDVDEVGSPPDGLDGTANPLPPPDGTIGQACGVDVGECQQGAYACVNGVFACLGGQGAVPEICDCKDNDCNGQTDNPNPGNGPALCSPDKDCVSSSVGCQCAKPCGVGEIPCPAGQICEEVTDSQTGTPLGKYCIADNCGNCATKTVTDANDKTLCAPAGTMLPNCVEVPVCVCKGQAGCQEPCAGVTCAAGTVCTNFGPAAGTCVLDNCFNVPCQGCGKACNLGSCVDNPCTDTSCMPGEVCTPNADFTGFTCIPSCADQTCASDQICVDGQCVPACDPACAAGEVCDTSQSPPVCVTDLCTPNPCTNGACCDPLTGQCGNCPCEGVLCPDGQECQNGDCFPEQGGAGGGSSTVTGSTGTATSSTGTGPGATGAGGGGGAAARGVFGLATGGGGCACEAGAGADRTGGTWALAALAALAAVVGRRRRGGGTPPRAPRGRRAVAGVEVGR